jgi:outer membrane lipoprotein-sorting protein
MNFTKAFARALAPVAIVAVAAPAHASPASDLAQVEAHLRATQSMTASFVQTDQRGRSSAGTLQMKRPGKIRFQYGSGDLLLVSNGSTLTFVDYQVGQKSSWPLSRTPLSVLLAANPNVKSRAKIVGSGNPDVVVVRAADPRQFGTLTLAFMRDRAAPGGLKLYGWTAIDAQNKRTTVKLSNIRYNVGVAETAFRFQEPKKRG